MVDCVTFLSIFSPSSGKIEQRTCPCCLKTTQSNPQIPPDTACASHPLATLSTANPHPSQPSEHKVPKCAVAFTSGYLFSHCVHCSAPALKDFGSLSCQRHFSQPLLPGVLGDEDKCLHRLRTSAQFLCI